MMILVRGYRARDVHAMQNDMKRKVNALFGGHATNKRAPAKAAWMPPVDLTEGDEAFTLKVELPGFSKDDVQVEIKDNRLTLKGERKRETEVQEAQYHRAERAYGSFQRSIRLPVAVDADKAEAIFKDGLLKLTLPKADAAKPKLIRITA
jgi:HSP20 family protein